MLRLQSGCGWRFPGSSHRILPDNRGFSADVGACRNNDRSGSVAALVERCRIDHALRLGRRRSASDNDPGGPGGEEETREDSCRKKRDAYDWNSWIKLRVKQGSGRSHGCDGQRGERQEKLKVRSTKADWR